MATTHPAKLDLIAIEEVNGQPAHLLLLGDDVWGFVVKVVIEDKFQGFQVVRWTDTPCTMRLATWQRVTHLINRPLRVEIDYPGWQDCEDLYAEDVLAAELVEWRRAREEAATAKQARLIQEAETAAKRVAARIGGATVEYHGSLVSARGIGRLIDWCDCEREDCDGVVMEVDAGRLHHVHLRSFSLVSATEAA